MARNWTPEERRKQAEAMRKWKPWEQSTGPQTPEGKQAVRQNSLHHGFRSGDMEKIRRLLRLQRDFVKLQLAGISAKTGNQNQEA